MIQPHHSVVAPEVSLVHKTNTRTDNTIKRNFDQLDQLQTLQCLSQAALQSYLRIMHHY